MIWETHRKRASSQEVARRCRNMRSRNSRLRSFGRLFMPERGRVVTMILDLVLGMLVQPDTNVVDVHIYRLRGVDRPGNSL